MEEQKTTHGAVITRTKAGDKTKRPSLYGVVMLNDDYTPMEFVVDILQSVFHKNHEEATEIMFHVHNRGSCLCGVYTSEIAETKVTQVVEEAQRNQHPLRCAIRKV